MNSTPGNRTLTVTIDARLSARVPGYVLGLIAVPDIDVVKDAPAVAEQLTTAEDTLHAERLIKADISALPSITAWRDTYRAVDVNPNRFPCAAESVLRRVAKGDRLPRINSLVDLCNATSLDSRLPVASCDVGDIESELDVRLAHGTETYLPLGAPDSPEHPEPGEVVYADGRGRAHSRRWNWRQGDVVKTGIGRRRILLTVESVHEGGRADVERVLGRLTDVLTGLGMRSGPAPRPRRRPGRGPRSSSNGSRPAPREPRRGPYSSVCTAPATGRPRCSGPPRHNCRPCCSTRWRRPCRRSGCCGTSAIVRSSHRTSRRCRYRCSPTPTRALI